LAATTSAEFHLAPLLARPIRHRRAAQTVPRMMGAFEFTA
jgi:hypothetical protein